MSGLFFLIRVRLAGLCCVASPIQFLRHFYSTKAICRTAPSDVLLPDWSPRAIASWSACEKSSGTMPRRRR